MRRRRRSLLLVTLVVLGSLGALVWDGRHEVVALHQQTVVRDVGGVLVPLGTARYAVEAPSLVGPGRVWPPGDDVEPQVRDVGQGVATGMAAGDALWLAAGLVPQTVPGAAVGRSSGAPPAGATAYGGMAGRALLDLRTLTSPAGSAPGAVLAAPSPNWRYVWPRDAAFVAVAYARTGHVADAVAVLGFLQAQQGPGGALQARYLPTGEGAVPDDRGLQEDGPGWALWAVAEVLRAESDADRREVLADALLPLVTGSTTRLLAQLDPATGLPRVSPDYWEVPEDELTLGIAATSAIGLDWAAWLAETGWVAESEWARAGVDVADLRPAADAVRVSVRQGFGPGYPRHRGGPMDAAVTFLGPPFARCPFPGAEVARAAAVPDMRRHGGGVAPGAGWKQDGISWTPQTALLAVSAAATGRPAEAERWLDWLAAHRTEAGSLPEKVLYDGRPAAVAPLAWTSALVLMALTPTPGAPGSC